MKSVNEADGNFAGWIAGFNGKKVEIKKGEAKDLWSAKELAAKQLKVPKSKRGLLWIKPAVAESVTEGKKVFKVNPQIGKAKYSISSHDGVKKHKDGSDFFDIETFKNKVDLEKAIKNYTSKGFKMESVNEATKRSVSKIVDAISNVSKEMKTHAGYYTKASDAKEKAKHLEHLKKLTAQKKTLEKELDAKLGELDKDVELKATDESVLRSLIRNKITESLKTKINEGNELTRELSALSSTLEKARTIAVRIGKLAKKDPDVFSGTEALDVAEYLEKIYAGLMTGNSNDKSYNDEIFK